MSGSISTQVACVGSNTDLDLEDEDHHHHEEEEERSVSPVDQAVDLASAGEAEHQSEPRSSRPGSSRPDSSRPGSPEVEKVCCYECYKQVYRTYAVEVPDELIGLSKMLCSEECAAKFRLHLEERNRAREEREALLRAQSEQRSETGVTTPELFLSDDEESRIRQEIAERRARLDCMEASLNREELSMALGTTIAG